MFGSSSAHLFRVEQKIRTYLVERLLPLTKTDIGSCRVSVPLEGVNTLVRIVRIDKGPGYVVRVLPRSKRRKMRDLTALYRILRENRVNVPEILDWVENFSKSGLVIYTERLLEGKTLTHRPLDPATVPKLGELLIPLHKTKSERWGSPLRPRGGDFSRHAFKRVLNRLRAVRKGLTRRTSPSVFREIRDWFAGQRHRFHELRRFDLIHDKINPGNLLWTHAEKRYYLLDLQTTTYGVKTKDLVALYHEVLDNDSELIGRFERAYFDGFPPEEQQLNRSLWPWYHAYYHLAGAAAQIKRARKDSPLGSAKTNHYEKFLAHWEALSAIIKEK